MTDNVDPRETLGEIRDEIEWDTNRAVGRAKTWIGVRIFLIVFVVGYMTWIFGAVSELNADELTKIAATSFEERLPDMRAELRDYALQLAPELTDRAMEMMVEIPAHLREAVEGQLLEKTDALVVRFERELDDAIGVVIDEQVELILAESPNNTPEEQLDALILGVSDIFRSTMTEAMDGMYLDYAQQLQELNGHLDHLLRGTDLTEGELIDKQLIEAWMVLVHRDKIASPNRVFGNIQAAY